MPSFLNAALTEEDGIVKISIDNSRHILYTLTEKGTIEVYDMGDKGNSFSRVTKMSQTTLVNEAMKIMKYKFYLNYEYHILFCKLFHIGL